MKASNTQKQIVNKIADKKVSEVQKINTPKGRAMLQWYGKQAPKSIEWYPAQEKEVYGDTNAKDFNKIFWGDNKQVLSHLLKDYRGKVDLIYIDPPFDSKADYVKRIKLKGSEIDGVEQNVLEQMQYTDIWEKDEYLQFMYERLIIMRELLSDKGSIYLHCDWHKSHILRAIMEEVFGEENLQREIIWSKGNVSGFKSQALNWIQAHDNIFYYVKNNDLKFFNKYYEEYSEEYLSNFNKIDEDGRKYWQWSLKERRYLDVLKGMPISDVWSMPYENNMSKNRTDYPTQKPEALLERIIKASSNEGDLVLDCFMGSGTTCAVAQKLNRRWIGCDINKGAIITTTQRLNKIITEQSKENLFGKECKGLDAFKVLNVNHYEVFTNDIQAKQLLIETYKIDELTRGDFDGTLGADYVKIVSPNRVLSKLDISLIIDAIKKNKDQFIVKKVSKQNEATFENKVIVICSGAELDVRDYIKNENNTGVDIEVRDIQIDKKELDFKKPTEATIAYNVKGNVLSVEVKDYYSPLLMKRLELENDKRLSLLERVKLFDYRQALEHIVIDVNYGEGQKTKNEISFNAEIFTHKEKKTELVETVNEYTYEKKGVYTVAVKIVDVLGEEYFETHKIEIK